MVFAMLSSAFSGTGGLVSKLFNYSGIGIYVFQKSRNLDLTPSLLQLLEYLTPLSLRRGDAEFSIKRNGEGVR